MLFPLFVYGTLKKGFSNYARHCASAVSIEPAWCWGRLYSLDAGYPAMELPELSIQAVGTIEYKLDARNQGKVLNFEQPRGDWDMIQGELMYFKKPDQEIPPIDLLEEFEPGNSQNLYERVLITVKTEKGLVNAWTYMMKDGKHVGSRLSLNQEGVVEWKNHNSGHIGESQTASSLF